MPISRMVLLYPSTGVIAGSPSAAVTDDALASRMNLSRAAGTRRVPLLMIRAGKDEIPGLLPLLDTSIGALLTADASVEVLNIPGEPHSLDMLRDTRPVRAAIERALRFVTRDATR